MAVIKREWKTYDSLYAIDKFRSYWLENERLISSEADRLEVINAPKWNPQTEEEHGEFESEKQMARYFHDSEILPTFRYSCVVMLYVIVERELVRLVKNLEKEHGLQKLQHKDIRGDLIEQIQKFSEVFFGLCFTACPNYQSLHDLRKIRNCIVHCHGEVNLSKDARHLIGLNNSVPIRLLAKLTLPRVGLPRRVQPNPARIGPFVNQPDRHEQFQKRFLCRGKN